GFYAPAQLGRDARDHGFQILPIDVTASGWDCDLEPGPEGAPALRLGLRLAKGLGEAEAAKIVAARGNGYADPYALRRRAGVSAATLERLAEADAFAGMGLSRREALWAARRSGASPGPLFEHLDADATHQPEPAFSPPDETAGEAVAEDYASARLSLKAHPLALARPLLPAAIARRPLLTAAEIADPDRGRAGLDCAAAGVVVVRQRPGSAKGVVFVTIEDETGSANLVVWPGVFEQVRQPLLSAKLLVAVGRLQREATVVHLVVDRLIDRTDLLAALWRGEAGTEADFPLGFGRGDEVRRPNEDRRPEAQARLVAARSGGRAFGHPRLSGAAFPSRDFH
ncbi:MAG: OB-fold nucleic acid binding domain-containing protein, partial [Pseudomonadota bacterium]